MEAATSSGRLVGLPPVVGAGTRVLVLGSFPGAASLAARQYYGHARNQFWPILAALWPQHPLPDRGHYAARCDWLLARGLGLWDVYAACERQGSLDASIRNARVNDFAARRAQAPRLAAIAHNGGESFRHAAAVRASLGQGDGAAIASLRLPSTSPANASWSLDRKLQAWGETLAAFGPNAAGRVLRCSRTCQGQHPRRCGGFLRSPPRCSWLQALPAPGCRCARSRGVDKCQYRHVAWNIISRVFCYLASYAIHLRHHTP